MQDANFFQQGAPSSSGSSSRTVRAVPRHMAPDAASISSFYMNPQESGTTESLDTLYTITQSRYGAPVPPARTSSLAVRGRHQAGIPGSSSMTGAGASIGPGMNQARGQQFVPGLHPQYMLPAQGQEGDLPSVQVTHPTPTKSRRFRRRSAGQAVPLDRESLAHENTLDVKVDPFSGPDAEPSNKHAGQGEAAGRDDDDEEDEEDLSEAEKQKEKNQARKARAREMGKLRQRRKRERDKKAKEEARLTDSTSNMPSTSLLTATHLPIPARNSSAVSLNQNMIQMGQSSQPIPTAMSIMQGPGPQQQQQQPYPFTMSVPSSTSSTYSPLPQAPSGFFSLSPNTNTSFASVSISGRSTPNTVFSPSISTPGMGTSTSEGTPALLSAEASSSSSMTYDQGAAIKGKRSTRRQRALSNSVGAHNIGAHRTQPVIVPLASEGLKRGLSKSAKRRKSEPQPEEFRDPMEAKVGLGVMFDEDVAWQPVDPNSSSGDRPKVRRTHSEGAAVPLSVGSTGPQISRHRSSTPPPLSALPSDYMPSPAVPPPRTQQGEFFAQSVLLALSTPEHASALQAQLGMDLNALEELRADLAVVYDKWRMEKSMGGVTIGSAATTPNMLGPASIGMEQRQSNDGTSTSEDHEMEDDSTLIMGPRSGGDSHGSPRPSGSGSVQYDTSLYITPAPNRIKRNQAQAQTMPNVHMAQGGYSQIPQAHESPLAGAGMQYNTQMNDHTQGQHTRTRSLSSAQMVARGLIINPNSGSGMRYPNDPSQGIPPHLLHQSQPRWMDGVSVHDPANTSGSEGHTSGTSPTLQTPSTGQGSFPSTESLGMVTAQNMQINHGQTQPMSGHWRSATDPARSRMYVTQHGPSYVDQSGMNLNPGTIGMNQGSGGGLDIIRDGSSRSASGGSTTSTSGGGSTGEWPKAPSPLDSPLAMAKQGSAQSQRRNQVQTPGGQTPGQHTHGSPSMSGTNMGGGPVTLPRSVPGYYSSGPGGHMRPPPPPAFMMSRQAQNHSGPADPGADTLAGSVHSGGDHTQVVYSTPMSQRNFRSPAVPFTPPTPASMRGPGQGAGPDGSMSGNDTMHQGGHGADFGMSMMYGSEAGAVTAPMAFTSTPGQDRDPNQGPSHSQQRQDGIYSNFQSHGDG